MKTTVRDFHSLTQLNGGKTYFDLPVIFEGNMNECSNFCQKKGYFWVSDDNIFGGYYINDEGKCLIFV